MIANHMSHGIPRFLYIACVQQFATRYIKRRVCQLICDVQHGRCNSILMCHCVWSLPVVKLLRFDVVIACSRVL